MKRREKPLRAEHLEFIRISRIDIGEKRGGRGRVRIVGADAQLITTDPVLGAPIDTASPANPAATFAKIVDLDPDMQFRT